MATGTIKWFEKTGGLGYVSVHVDTPIAVKGRKGRFKKLSDVEFVTVKLEPAEHLETVEIKGATIVSGQQAEISGEWRSFVSRATDAGTPTSNVAPSHVHEAFGLDDYDLPVSAIGLEEPIGDYGVHVVPVHLGKGLFASIFVNIATSIDEAEKQKNEFFEKAAEVSFKIETRYPYLPAPDEERTETAQGAQGSGWLEANMLSLSGDARELADRMEATASYVSDICRKIA